MTLPLLVLLHEGIVAAFVAAVEPSSHPPVRGWRNRKVNPVESQQRHKKCYRFLPPHEAVEMTQWNSWPSDLWFDPLGYHERLGVAIFSTPEEAENAYASFRDWQQADRWMFSTGFADHP